MLFITIDSVPQWTGHCAAGLVQVRSSLPQIIRCFRIAMETSRDFITAEPFADAITSAVSQAPARSGEGFALSEAASR
jgi:hypothetical protein